MRQAGLGTIPILLSILCVHGLCGDPYLTWTALESSAFWPQNLLPEDVPGLRILTFGYQAEETHFTTEVISERAENLLKELVEWRDPDQKVSKTSYSLIFIILFEVFAGLHSLRCSFRIIIFVYRK